MRVFNYEIVRNCLLSEERFWRISEIAKHSGLEYNQVQKVIAEAWKIGWVSRIERFDKNNNAWGKGKFKAIATAYKIKRKESWMGLTPLYKQIMQEQKRK